MTLERILRAAATAVLCLSTAAFAQAQITSGESTVSGSGVERIRRKPEILRMELEISAKGKTLGAAIKKLEAHRDAALNQLAKMSSEKEKTRAGEVQLGNSANSQQQQQMEMMIRQRMLQPGQEVKQAGEKPVSVSCKLTAVWKLQGNTTVELLLEAQAIEDKVRAAELVGMDSEEKTAEEEAVAAEVAQQLANMNDDSQLKPGEPTFLYVSKVSPEDRAKATAAAFAKARKQAEELSTAAGAELGALRGLSRQSSLNETGMEIFSAYGVTVNQQLLQAVSDQAERDEGDGTEAIGTQPSEVVLPITVTAAFQLKPAK